MSALNRSDDHSEGLAGAADAIAEAMALSFPVERYAELARGLAAAAGALGIADIDRWISDLARRGVAAREAGALASALTVAETYFFRERDSFVALQRHVLPDLIAARRASGRLRLRLWSAGCATGEEAYSLSMVLETLLADIDAWDITILATDINAAALRQARAATYRNWSFRNVSPDLRDSFFRPGPDGRFVLKERVRRRVTFVPLNLAENTFPSPLNDAREMDVIFCRNVLLYFTRPQAAAVVGRLSAALINGGWLVVGAAECSAQRFQAFETVRVGPTVLYRKSLATHISAPVAPVLHFPSRERLAPASVPQPTTASASRARRLADQGALAEALAIADDMVARDRTDAVAHQLRGSILTELGRGDDAALALDRAIFLDPEFALAYCMRGILAHGQGQGALARKRLTSALAIVGCLAPHAAVAGDERLTAGALADMAQAVLEQMGGAA